MKILKYKKDLQHDIELKIMNTYEISKSSQEIVYSDLECDFTNFTTEDLPEKYQEVEIIDISDGVETIKYFGYIDSYMFDEMRESDKFRPINITLLSPMKMATLRTFIAVGTYTLKDLLENILLSPLLYDGFTLEELNISDRTLIVNYLSETVEYALNDLSGRYNFWWFIDEGKKIYIKDISQMLNSDPKYIYDSTHKIKNLQYIKPKIMSDNYANLINFTNVRVYDNSNWQYIDGEIIANTNGLLNQQISTLKKDGVINFNYPIDIKKENIQKAGESNELKNIYYALLMSGTYSDDSTFSLYIRYNVETNSYEMTENIGFDGNEDTSKEFLLTRDPFFNNLITGFKYNNENKNVKEINLIVSDSILVWNVNRFYNDKAINQKKGIINNTGIVELTIDMNEQWKTRQELQEMGISYMNKNSLKLDGEIELKVDGENLFKIGDIIKINKMLFNDKYIVTKIRESFKNGVIEYFITCKNSNITDNYIDLFRSATKQQKEEKVYQINISHYVEEGIKETFEVVK